MGEIDDGYNLDRELIGQADASIKTSESPLPFATPTLYVLNGQPAFQQIGGAMFFGGWATDRQRFDRICESEKRNLPAVLKPAQIASSRGEPIDVYQSRAIVMTPAAIRSSWVSRDNNKRLRAYTEGTRRHVQVLSILATVGTQHELVIWGPVVLSAKGFQAKKLLVAFDDWSRYTANARAAYASHMPAWMFWCAIGTFGSERKQEMVGQGQQRSPITPLELHKPELTPEKLRSIFGGEALLNLILEVQKQSVSWLSGWDQDQSIPARRRTPDYGLASTDIDETPF